MGWERKLKDFYDVAEVALQKDSSKETVKLLKGKLLQKLQILEGIKIERFGKTEWIRYVSDLKDEDIIPKGRIRRDSSPVEIFTHLLDYHVRLKRVYGAISDSLITRNQKELFESLALFKEEQIQEIKRLKDNYTLEE